MLKQNERSLNGLLRSHMLTIELCRMQSLADYMYLGSPGHDPSEFIKMFLYFYISVFPLAWIAYQLLSCLVFYY